MDKSTRAFLLFVGTMVGIVFGIVMAGVVQGDGVVVYVLTGAIPVAVVGLFGRACRMYYAER